MKNPTRSPALQPCFSAPRREFIRQAVFVAAATPFLLSRSASVWAAAAKAEPLPPGTHALDEKNPMAAALGFKLDATKVDVKKYPKRAGAEGKKQTCKSCNFFTGINGSWGKCSIFADGLVSTQGWCSSWALKS